MGKISFRFFLGEDTAHVHVHDGFVEGKFCEEAKVLPGGNGMQFDSGFHKFSP
jgi:hypothetical protein